MFSSVPPASITRVAISAARFGSALAHAEPMRPTSSARICWTPGNRLSMKFRWSASVAAMNAFSGAPLRRSAYA